MGKQRKTSRTPERAKARRARQREAKERGARSDTPRAHRPSAQWDHASNPRGQRRAREGERRMEGEA